MVGGSFFDRIDELDERVGHGDLVVRTEFDQVYAKYQELRDDLKHPRGGQAHYVRDGLVAHSDEYLQTLAETLLTDLRGGAVRVANDLAARQEQLAPVEFENLRRSGHPQVIDDGELYYDRPPDVPRLSEEQLKDQRRLGYGLDHGADSARPRK